jgi:hypothetical protein
MTQTHSLSTELCVQIVQAHSRHVHTVASACLHAHAEPAAVHSVIRLYTKKKQRSKLQLLKTSFIDTMTNQSLVAGMYNTAETTALHAHKYLLALLFAKHCTYAAYMSCNAFSIEARRPGPISC